ncbi:nickel pincer cofactor biosynthesis protein LarC [Nostocoides sp. F2B08]|uniref:nickel pincer cofactor biosynthesis protein LarC n=1 Tax=Nostocoides sp. F2B08 TaxID=2653936 RepID=UPI0012631849|nr:nickel pincer cofactor biosynthesis protein LarC [Tetrasphaera sp. F2B08]KAB7744246.1 nickel pincer cofactor biosynthesis protein LarC [Tetrasphaera sp. F2B08]
MTRPRRVLWLDASAGIAGDMVLAALVDAGADRDEVSRVVGAVAPEVRIAWEGTTRAGLRGLRAIVSAEGSVPNRSVAGIRGVLDSDELPEAVRELASRVFDRIVAAESAVHGMPPESVHLHEVGGWDSIADIVGACAALTMLDIDEVVVSPIAVGSGHVRAAHGVLSVPVPGVTELLRGWEISSGGDGELATPTGAALAVTLAERQGHVPTGRLVAVGVGAGTRDRPDRANVVRALVLEVTASDVDSGGASMLDEIACTVDDLDPRVWPTVLTRLLDGGALDAWLVPALMKKGRPAHVLHVLCRPEDTARLGSFVLEETSSLGYRVTRVDRIALERAWVDVFVEGEGVQVKLAIRDGMVLRVVAEFDDAVAAATRLDRPVRDVLESAVQAAAERGIVAGAPVPDDARAERSPGTPA